MSANQHRSKHTGLYQFTGLEEMIYQIHTNSVDKTSRMGSVEVWIARVNESSKIQGEEVTVISSSGGRDGFEFWEWECRNC